MNFDLVNNRTKINKKIMIKGDVVLGRGQLGVGLAPYTMMFFKSFSFDISLTY